MDALAHRRRFSRRHVVAGLGALALTRSAFAQQADAGREGLVAGARKEGRITIYNGSNFRIVRKLGDVFAKRYGVAVDVLDARTTEIRERIRAEQASGRTVASLSFSGWTTLSTQKDEGVWGAVGALPNLARLRAPLAPDPMIAPVCVGNFAMIVNSALVSVQDEPKSWFDLADPKWKGRILSDDPRAAGAGNVWFEATYEKFGRAFHEKIAAQDPVFSRMYPESQRRLARGEFAIYLPFNISEYVGLRGLPIRVVIPKEGVAYVPFALAMLRDAPAPNAAKLFIDFALDDEQQAMFALEGFRPAVEAAMARTPDDLKPFVNAPLLGTTRPGRLNEMTELAKIIYK